MKYLVGIDEGTTGCKAFVFDEMGHPISHAGREYPSYYPKPGYVEQDLNEIRDRVFESCKEAVEKSGVNRDDIVGVSFSNQGAMILLDENGDSALPHVIGWQDMRHAEILPELRHLITDEEYFEKAGMPFGFYNVTHLNWLQKNDPEGWKKVKMCGSHLVYLMHQFGADGFYIDESDAGSLNMMNVNTRDWDDDLLKIYNIDRSYLPEIIHEPGKCVGHVTESVSEKTGLPVGCNVALGGHDVNICKLGVGAKDGGTESMVVGTAGVSVLITDEKVTDPTRRISLRPNPGFDNYQQYILTYTAASSFRWFRDELCSFEVAASKLMNIDPYDMMTTMAKNSKPGANGVTALTCLQGSHGKHKNEKARGTFLGISLGTTKADIAEAILEGITFEMYDIIKMNESYTPVNKVRLCGGVIKSPYWCQMFADVFNKPIEITEVTELGALGAAMCAGISAGLYKDCNDAIEKCVKLAKTYLPEADRHEEYMRAYQTWSEAYEALNEVVYK